MISFNINLIDANIILHFKIATFFISRHDFHILYKIIIWLYIWIFSHISSLVIAKLTIYLLTSDFTLKYFTYIVSSITIIQIYVNSSGTSGVYVNRRTRARTWPSTRYTYVWLISQETSLLYVYVVVRCLGYPLTH